MIWNAVIFGPHDTPFEDGTFKLTIEFTEEYPNKPPTVRFVSHMFHPNVYADGGICLDILQNRWSPTYDVSAILTSIQVSENFLLGSISYNNLGIISWVKFHLVLYSNWYLKYFWAVLQVYKNTVMYAKFFYLLDLNNSSCFENSSNAWVL